MCDDHNTTSSAGVKLAQQGLAGGANSRRVVRTCHNPGQQGPAGGANSRRVVHTCHSPGQQGLAGARLPDEQHALRQLGAERAEPVRVLQELHHVRQLLLRFVSLWENTVKFQTQNAQASRKTHLAYYARCCKAKIHCDSFIKSRQVHFMNEWQHIFPWQRVYFARCDSALKRDRYKQPA